MATWRALAGWSIQLARPATSLRSRTPSTATPWMKRAGSRTTCRSGAPARSAARYEIGDGLLRLIIEADRQPWCPEIDGETRVSSLQTGVFAGPVGSTVGQSRFKPGLVVWTPEYVAFFLDHRLVKTVEQSPAYPMQFMLGIYEFPDGGQSTQPPHPYPKAFIVDYVRGYRTTNQQPGANR